MSWNVRNLTTAVLLASLAGGGCDTDPPVPPPSCPAGSAVDEGGRCAAWHRVADFPAGSTTAHAQLTRLDDGRVLAAVPGESGSVWIYDPASDAWASLVNTMDVVSDVLALPGGRVLAVGLEPVDTPPCFKIYDGGWSVQHTLQANAASWSYSVLADGNLLAAGTEGDGTTPQAMIYDLGQERFVLTGAPLLAHVDDAAIRLPDGRTMIAGSLPSDRAASDAAEIYDPTTGTWKLTARLPTPQLVPVLELATDAGGTTSVLALNAQPGVAAELVRYSLADDTWTPLPGLPARYEASDVGFTGLADGEILLAGGSGRAEIFDGTAWTSTAAMPDGEGPTSLLTLADGRVLALQGTVASVFERQPAVSPL